MLCLGWEYTEKQYMSLHYILVRDEGENSLTLKVKMQ